jgi:hypothetical protein
VSHPRGPRVSARLLGRTRKQKYAQQHFANQQSHQQREGPGSLPDLLLSPAHPTLTLDIPSPSLREPAQPTHPTNTLTSNNSTDNKQTRSSTTLNPPHCKSSHFSRSTHLDDTDRCYITHTRYTNTTTVPCHRASPASTSFE